jgi:UPF0755 protein
VLDAPVVTTDGSARNAPGPYNTYLNFGLTPTPISAPSQAALKAAATPADGPWVYFVKCQKDGTSCFSVTEDEHRQAIREARARGAY